ncbi:MAG: hypothetical protein DRP85_08885 [Candidatus Makaraimicrobium thalassicum]|nr:MAG: hypothetical protein DRP85_08885 [Candidatus Omnitrophota bacterium]
MKNGLERAFHDPECDFIKVGEVDPDGLAANAPGAKLDKGKLKAHLLADFGPALLKVAEVLDYGSGKYSPHGWLEVKDPEERYMAAFWRHLLHGKGKDQESGISHRVHACWNLLAAITLEKEGE